MTLDTTLASVEPRSLAATRVALHHATFLVSAVGRCYAVPQPGSRHAALTWDETRRALRGAEIRGVPAPFHAELRFDDAAIALSPGPAIRVAGRRFSEVVAQFRADLAAAGADTSRFAVRQPPDLEPGPMTAGGVFEVDLQAASALGRWFGFANDRLASVAAPAGVAMPMPCWPDHFDLAAVVPVGSPAPSGAQVSLGFSPGDGSIEEPYFYVTAWPMPPGRVAEVPAPAGGRWQVDGWVGLALTASVLVGSSDPSGEAATFLERGLEIGRDLVRTA